jgi:hypothetical protein
MAIRAWSGASRCCEMSKEARRGTSNAALSVRSMCSRAGSTRSCTRALHSHQHPRMQDTPRKFIFLSLLHAVIDDGTFQNSRPLPSETGQDEICGLSIQRTWGESRAESSPNMEQALRGALGSDSSGLDFEKHCLITFLNSNCAQDNVVAKPYTFQPPTLPMTSSDHVDLTRHRW